MTAYAPPERFDLGRVFSRGFGFMTGRPMTLLMAALLFGYLPGVLNYWLVQIFALNVQSGAPDLMETLQRVGMLWGAGVLIGGVSWLLQGAVAAAVLSDASGRPISASDLMARLIGRLPMLYALGVLTTLAVILGYLLLIVPGVLLSLAWSVGAPIAMLEDRSFLGVLGRSAELTRGHRGILFLLFLIFGVAGAAISFGVRAVGGAALIATPGVLDPAIVTYGLQPLAAAVLSTILAAITASAYLELRGLKDGIATHGMASIFD